MKALVLCLLVACLTGAWTAPAQDLLIVTTAQDGPFVTISIDVQAIEPVYSFDLVLEHDAGVLVLDGIEHGAETETWMSAWNDRVPGVVRMGFATGTDPITTGTVVRLRFVAQGDMETADVRLTKFLMDEQVAQVSYIVGAAAADWPQRAYLPLVME